MLTGLPSGVENQVREGVAVLRGGGVVAFPTDTVYGLGVCPYLHRAVERVYAVKERPLGMALPLLLSSTLQINEVAEPVPPVARLLVEKFMPGPLTLVLYKSRVVPGIVTAGGITVAVRVPGHPVPVALALGLGAPISGTSANLSGRPSALTADDVHAQFGNKIDLVIDGGRCPGGRESTIVDVTGEVPVVLRKGAIDFGELKKVCASIILGGRVD
ncbi:MAG: L-threonylcarbamoyladenylate synthase [Dehalococcoidales bacterium]|nr:L-threonylcarbamoyladenylate synthase [Dehalococcoidales bacterium]